MNMELGLGNTLLAGDPRLVDHIVGEVKSQGIFDQFRKECIADVDTKPAYQNLRARVENSVNCFLGKQTWKADLNKNQLREILRKHIVEAPYLDTGVERIVDQVVNPKVYSVFMPQIEDVVYKCLGIERPKNRQRNGPCGFKDLLPKDLDPVSPESDKNSLKDVSLDSVDAEIDDLDNARDKEASIPSVDENRKDETDNISNDRDNGRDGETEIEDKTAEETARSATAASLNNPAKSEEKPEEEEEDSPMFEPIDIMNLNESNISNDSHLSGISELTSHRSRSPDFSNEASRDNMDFSNQDSQFSKVSSDSRLSIVTDFGSSNHASTPMSDLLRDDKIDAKFTKEHFKIIGESESGKGNRDDKSSYESERSKENTPSDFKFVKRSFASKESSRDGTESGTRDTQRSDSRSRKSDPKDSKKDRERDNRKKRSNHDAKSSEKSSSKSVRDKADERSREKEKKEQDRREKMEGKEVKDLKDLYKEKIRELREKKELTEKEKLSKDKDSKAAKETKEKRDSSREKREHKSSSSKSYGRSESKMSKSSNSSETKAPRSESRDKGKRDERRYPKDSKLKSSGAQSDEKGEAKRISRSDDKNEKSEAKQKSVARRDGKNNEKREAKSETEKEKKRREEKKAKTKDDHSSLRKNPEDRRSTDRDGSNGSNGKSSQKSGSSSGTSSAKAPASNLSKESTNTSNSSSETSDSIDESQNDKLSLTFDANIMESGNSSREYESQARKLDLGQSEISLPIKKRPFGEGSGTITNELAIKKPKFAKNFQEAKRLMKIRRKMEKEKIKRQQEMEKIVEVPKVPQPSRVVEKNDLEMVPDEERVQIIEVCDEEYDEPYPEVRSNFTPEERSQIILGAESIFSINSPGGELNAKSTLSEMELSIRQSLIEMISDKRIEDTERAPISKQTTAEESEMKGHEAIDRGDESCPREAESLTSAKESLTSDSIESQLDRPGIPESPVRPTDNFESYEKNARRETSEETVGNEPNVEAPETRENAELPVTPGIAEVPVAAENIERPETPENVEIAKISEIVGIPETQKNVDTVETVESAEISETRRDPEGLTSLKNADAPESLENKEKTESKAEEETPEATELQRSVDKAVPEVPAATETKPETFNEFPGNTAEAPVKLEDEDAAKVVTEDLECLDDDVSPCLYFTEDNERLNKFTTFMKAVEKEEECASSSVELAEDGTGASSDMDEVLSSVSKVMAPPKTKRKYSTSPLTDILLNNANNNNDAHKITAAIADEEVTANDLKKRKIGRPKKQRSGANLCGQQNLLNGENFVMPLSPESDVSASSEKTGGANPLKDEKSRPRGSNQRYASDDLYKPRPLFASSSRRSRRSNPS